jgi:hypothetical protein
MLSSLEETPIDVESGVDLSDEALIGCNHTPARDPTIDNPKANHNAASFLSLPVEIRLRIYDLLLVRRSFDSSGDASSRHAQKTIPLWFVRERWRRTRRVPRRKTIEPAVLRTCKQMYFEGNSVLYSNNTFETQSPADMSKFVAQIGLVNLKFIRTLVIFVGLDEIEISSWLQLLDMLAKDASGLRRLELEWGVLDPFKLHREAEDRGFGDNLDFVHALAKISGLKQLVISGFYAKHWPAYLQETMSVSVQAIRCHKVELWHTSPNLESLRRRNEMTLRSFMKYQQETEDLIP